ncbi:hypothetical protein DN051_32320 [Streptomyces cadmiisoli]|uniref:Uncharacterized protein n=1 Tax=Streptomyces cadmiisoli TaxID=2184053 RepID=A0A2Z4J6E8_9ACTN|nr:hypothetical protein DN051_32320 [Streptomyces cadmiisoli]
MTDSKLFSTANRTAIHHKDNAEKCNTAKRAAAREFSGFPTLTLEEAQDIKPCANCVTEVEAEMILMEEAQKGAQEAPEGTTPDPEAQEGQEDATEAQEAPDGPDGGHAEYVASMEANKPDQEEDQEDDGDDRAPEEIASEQFGVSDPWKALENWGRAARSARANGSETGYEYWMGKADAIGEVLGAE